MEKVYLEIHELYDFFRKYDIHELDVLNTILDYVKYDTSSIVSALNNVYDEKEIDCFDEDEREFNYLDALNKNDLLTEKELAFLYQIIFDASFFLQTVEELSGYLDGKEKIDITKYPVNEMINLYTEMCIYIDEKESNVLTR